MIETLNGQHSFWVDAANLVSGLNIVLIVAMLVRRMRSGETSERRPLIPEKAADDAAVRRRRAAKRWNERIKLLAAFTNTIGAASFLAIVVVPAVQLGGQGLSMLQALAGVGIAVGAQIVGQLLLTAWKTEE